RAGTGMARSGRPPVAHRRALCRGRARRRARVAARATACRSRAARDARPGARDLCHDGRVHDQPEGHEPAGAAGGHVSHLRGGELCGAAAPRHHRRAAGAGRYPRRGARRRARRSGGAGRRRCAVRGGAGSGARVGAGLIAWVSGRSLLAGFATLFMLLLSVAAVTPAALRVLAQAAARLGARLSPVARLACGDIAASLSRTGVASAALGMALTAMIGVAIMVESFRESLREWLIHTLRADVYVSAPGPAEASERRLDPAV